MSVSVPSRFLRSLPPRGGNGRVQLGISLPWLGLSFTFDGVNTLILPHLLLSLAGNAAQATTLGLLTFAGLILGMIVQPVAGVLSDRLRSRWGRKPLIVFGLALLITSLSSLAQANTLVLVAAAYIVLQLGANTAQAAQQGYIPDLIPPASRGLASGLKGLMDLSGAMLGFLLLGQLLEAGRAGPSLLVAGVVVVTPFLLMGLLVREQGVLIADLKPRIAVRHAFHIDLVRHRTFLRATIARFFFLLGTYAVGRFFLYFLADRLHIDPSQAAGRAGSILAALTLITAMAAVPAGWGSDRWGRRPVMMVGAILSMTGVLLLTFVNALSSIMLAGGLMALGSAAFSAANWALTSDLVPPGEGARFMGVANFGTAGAAAAAGLFGLVVDKANASIAGAGYPALFVLSAAAFGLSIVAAQGLRKSGSVVQTERVLAN